MNALRFPKAGYEPGVVGFGNGSFAYLQPDGGWGFSNAGLVTSDGEALLIDTLFDFPHTRAMLDGFRVVTDAKIRTLVNTHHNGDHCYGNALVEGVEIIATKSATEAMHHENPEMLARLMSIEVAFGKGRGPQVARPILYRKGGSLKVNWNWFRVLPDQGDAVDGLREAFRLVLERLVMRLAGSRTAVEEMA